MIRLYDAGSGAALGEITEEQLAFLQEQFEEEWSGDQDDWINGATIDMLQEAGADEALRRLLRQAVGSRGEADIRWSRE